MRNRIRISLASMFAIACGSSSTPPENDRGPEDASSDAAVVFSDAAASAADGGDCSDASKLVYVMDNLGQLVSFDPKTMTFHTIGTFTCGGVPRALAIARDGTAYVTVYDYNGSLDGTLWKVSLADASCTPTSYTTGQHGLRIYGLGFASNGASAETLYACTEAATCQIISGCGTSAFATLAVPSFDLSPAGSFTNGLAGKPCILTGTSAGSLFGTFLLPDAGQVDFAQIDETTGATPSPLSLTDVGFDGNKSMAPPFAFWGGSFWFFKETLHVVQYTPNQAPVDLGKGAYPTSFGVPSGAGVSTCAPLVMPN